MPRLSALLIRLKSVVPRRSEVRGQTSEVGLLTSDL